MPNPFEDFTDLEVIDALENGVEVEKTTHSEGWKIIDEAFKRLSEQAQRELLTVPADQLTRIVELQTVAKFYKSVFESVVNSYKQEGKLAFTVAKERDFEI